MAKPKIGKYHTKYLFMAAAERYTRLLEKRAKVEDNVTSMESSHDNVEHHGGGQTGYLFGCRGFKAGSDILSENLSG